MHMVYIPHLITCGPLPAELMPEGMVFCFFPYLLLQVLQALLASHLQALML